MLPQGPQVWAPLLAAANTPSSAPCPLMTMGIDVSHGLSGSNAPSVAAVVASQEPSCSRYAAAIMEQTPGHEIVLGMEEAAQQLLQAHRMANNGCLPRSLLVFRDGVSDSMYAEVLVQEVEGIRAAGRALDPSYNPKVGWYPHMNMHCIYKAVHFWA